MSLSRIEDRVRRFPEISLEEEWNRQANIMSELFAAQLNLSTADYIESLPQFPKKSESFASLHLAKPIMIETRLPWFTLADLAGTYISRYFLESINKVQLAKNQGDNSTGLITTLTPYCTWIEQKTAYPETPEVIHEFQNEERGGNIFEGIADWYAYPVDVTSRCIDLVGSVVGEDGIPYMYYWYGKPLLDYHPLGYALPFHHPLISSREVAVK